ncbi:hypothetical protein [Oceanicaulis sp.]|uniref:hypothetical protein n=1 Tax=Oceanicaulis sp. TaxID=1924941 RepID=UPI003F6F0707
MSTLALAALLSVTFHQAYVESGDFQGAEAREEQTVDQYPCAYYGAAIAPLGTDSRLCGMSWNNGDLFVRHRGEDSLVGSNLAIRASQGAFDRGEFWVMRKGDAALAGIRRDLSQNAVMISRDEGEWRSTRINCGEYGFAHAFPLSDANRYTVVAYSSEGSYLFCRLDFWTHEQTQTWVEGPIPSIPLDELQIQWGDGPNYLISTRNGEEIFRSSTAD